MWLCPSPVQVLLTFLLVTIGWVVFRRRHSRPGLENAGGDVCRRRPPQGGSTLLSAVIYTRGHLILMALCAVLVFQPCRASIGRGGWTGPKGLVLVVLFALSLMTLFAQSFRSFLYFQF